MGKGVARMGLGKGRWGRRGQTVRCGWSGVRGRVTVKGPDLNKQNKQNGTSSLYTTLSTLSNGMFIIQNDVLKLTLYIIQFSIRLREHLNIT